MRPRPFARTRFVLLACISLLAFLLLLCPARAAINPLSASGALQSAWEKARQAGSYHFNSTVVQTTIPKPLIANVGVSSQEQRLYLEGDADQAARTLAMQVWSDDAGTLDPATAGLEVRTEGDRVMARQGEGPWKEIDNFSSSFAPQGDLLSFLSAADDVTLVGTETTPLAGPAGPETSLTYTRYAFRLDGPRMAAYVRDELQQSYAERGELPAEVQLELPQAYAQMTGEGELWIGADGLPLRQILHLHYPEQEDARVETEATTDLRFAPAAGAAARDGNLLGLLGQLQWPSLSQVAVGATWLALTAVLLGWLIWESMQRNKIYTPLAILLLLCMLLNPLLQDLKLASFLDKQTAQAAAAEGRRQEESTAGAAWASPSLPTSPHTPRLPAALAADGVLNCQDGDTSDLDEDGLNGCEEAALGTDPQDTDTDGDLITDTVEVAGFEYPPDSGTWWYPDPLKADTNGDGRADGVEWDPNGSPADWDLDGDNIPNVFDMDDDGDGVPDLVDLSPATAIARTFTPDAPFALIVEGLTPGEPTFVQFQLRPANPAHLGYAMNVVDWPKGDLAAQVQDADGRTWFDESPDAPLVPNSFGDVRVVPALEIEITGQYSDGILPDPAERERFGLSAIDVKGTISKTLFYVPLMVDTDPAGEGRVSLSGKMFYRPGEDWGNAQQVRLVWMVQLLNDKCTHDGQCTDYAYSAYNQPEVVQIYYDDWTLTGLNVREDHGADFAMIYEDPAVDPDVNEDGTLFALSYGLDNSFLAGRDQDDDGRPDITVGELYRRFNHTTNGGVSEEERWGISNTLSVVTVTYEYLDEGLATIAMTESKDLLAEAFGDPPAAPVTPTILFAHQDFFRAANLDLDSAMSWGISNTLRVHMAPPGDKLPLYTRVGVRWGPFWYDPAAGSWANYSIEDYWDEMARRYTFPGIEDPQEALGMMEAARLYYLALYRGPTVIVGSDDTVLESAYETDYNLRSTYKMYEYMVVGTTAVIGAVIYMIYKIGTVGTVFFRDLFVSMADLGYKADIMPLRQALIEKYRPQWWGRWGRTVVIGGLMVLLVAVLTVAIAYLLGDNSLKAKVIATAITTGVVIWNVITAVRFIRVWTGGSLVPSFAGAHAWMFTGWQNFCFGLILLIISLIAIWAIVIHQWWNGQLTGVALHMAVTFAIAASVLLIFLFVVSFIPVLGELFWLAGIILLIADLIQMWRGEETWTEQILKSVVNFFYGFEAMVRFAPHVSNQQLTYGGDPHAGMAEGNSLNLAVDVTTNFSYTEPQDWRVWWFGLGNYTAENQRSTSVDYVLAWDDPSNPPLTPTVAANSTIWDTVRCSTYGGLSRCSGSKQVRRQLASPVPLQAGLNRTLPIYFITAYDLPTVECWLIPGIPIPLVFCNTNRIADSMRTDPGYRMDVFPATLDGFFAMNWDSALKPPQDADGDGLVSAAYNGPDPNDALWDTDGDGLSDGYELKLRQEGVAISANSADSDGDGLSDAAEVRYGSDPGRADTDGDGLTDKQEVDGWTLTITTLSNTVPIHTLAVHVTSDPAKYDTDGDGLSDRVEKTLHELAPTQFALNPRVANPNPVAFYAGVDDEDATVAPGTTLAYTATIANRLPEGVNYYVVGDLDVTLAPELQPENELDRAFSLFRGQAVTVTSPVYVRPDAPSGPAPITNTINAHLAGNPNCDTLWFDLMYCASEDDEEDWVPWDTTSEIYLLVNGTQIWRNDIVNGGGSYWMNAGGDYCGQVTVELWEDDWITPDDPLASWTIDMTNAGTFAQQIDHGTDFQGRIDYRVYGVSQVEIDLQEAIPLLVDDDSPTSALTSLRPGQYIPQVSGQDILVVGGEAHDPTSRVARVDVSVDDGPWAAAVGAVSWAYTWTVPIQPGRHTLRSRATDVVGHVYTETEGVSVIVDTKAPDADTPVGNGARLAARQDEQGRWTIPLYGTAVDLVGENMPDPPGSGIAAVEVLITGTDAVAGQGWQAATITPTVDGWDWSIDYLLPDMNNQGEVWSDPTGSYLFFVRARDNAGLVTPPPFYHGGFIHVDNTAPVATIADAGPWPALIDEPLTLTGIITDPGPIADGLDSLQISFTPAEEAGALDSALSHLLLLLHLDEPAGTVLWDDAAANAFASCDGANCPAAGVAGPSGSAVALDGVDDRLLVTNAPKLAGQSFAVALWARREGTGDEALLFQGGQEPARSLAMGFANGSLTCAFGDTALAAPIAADANWHQWGCAYDAASRTRTIYYDGAAVISDTAPVPYQGYGPLYVGLNPNGGNAFHGQIDEVTVWDRALTAGEVQALYQLPGLIWHWQPVELAQAGPGITRTTWTYPVPAGMEGIYQIDLRGRDSLGNRNARRANWPQWQGEIDTRVPRVDAGYAPYGEGPTARTAYTCTVEDLNLDEATWQCPCQVLPEDRFYYDTSWWQNWFTATERLYRIESSCIVPGYHGEPPTVGGCDRYGHCASWSPPLAGRPMDPSIDSVVLTPTYGAVFTSPAPIPVAGMAYAADKLQALTLTVNGQVHFTKSWPDGVWGDTWSTNWAPPGEGVYALVSVLEDRWGHVQTQLHPVTITVDLAPPQVLIAPAVFTSVQSLGPGWILLTGQYTEAGAVDGIAVQAPLSLSTYLRGFLAAQGRPAPASVRADGEASFGNGKWQYGWDLGRDPDGEPFNVTAVITDVAGRRATTTRQVLVDTAPPAPFTVTLSYLNSSGQQVPLQPGQAIRDKSGLVRLLIDWTASGDGSGLAYYLAGWTAEAEPDPALLTRYGPSTLHHQEDVGDLQVLYAHVAAEDNYGNRRWYNLGPIYVDYFTTPDLFPLAATGPVYHGWLDGHSQVGADRALQHNALYGQPITGTQRFYVSWDAGTLRLAWTGADWNHSGDLFIYLDTVPGGSTIAYNPYPATPDTVIDLPAQGGNQLAADYMVWVEDATTAGLWRWDGSAWVLAHSLAGYYRLDTSFDPAYTDLALPRNWLGLGPGVGLQVVALASEEDALRLWAAMPERNPLNSELANHLFTPAAAPHFALTQQYEWPALLLGVSPNQGHFADSDLRVNVASGPVGLRATFPETDLYAIAPGQFVDADLDGIPDMELNRESSPGLVGRGQVIAYTLSYVNEGPATAPGVVITATARGALELAGGNPRVFYLGDVPAGGRGTITLEGTVDTTVYTRSLEVDLVVADAIHGPYEWFWVQHDVDSEPPSELQIVAPRKYARPFLNTVRGTVVDASPVPSITLYGVGPLGPLPVTYCVDETPDDGNWVCTWDVGPANDGDHFQLRARASDVYGNTSDWTDWLTLTVDAQPPAISLTAASEAALQNIELGPGDSLLLAGEVHDDREAAAAEFCTGAGAGESCQEIRVLPGDGITGTWQYLLEAVPGLDHEPFEFHLHGRDGAGNISEPLARTCLVDTVPPAVTITFQRDGVMLGVPTPVLAGTIDDGSGITNTVMYLVLTAPDGAVASEPLAHEEGNWSYTLTTALSGWYTLQVEARDLDGNTRAYGPFSVFGGTRIYMPLVLR